MIDVRVHRNFPLNCIKLIIVVWPAWCPVSSVLPPSSWHDGAVGGAGGQNLLSSSLLVSPAWSELLVVQSRDISLPALTLSEHGTCSPVFPSSNFSTLLLQKLVNSVQNNSCK